MSELRLLCFSRFFEFIRAPKNCIIEGNDSVFPCDLVTLCQNDFKLCQNETVPTVHVISWVSHFILQSSMCIKQVNKQVKRLKLMLFLL